MHSHLSDNRLKVIQSLCHQVSNLEGSTAEVGVYRGGTSFLISHWLPHKKIHLFDTFKGIPYKGEYDMHNIGDFSDTTLDSVLELMESRNAAFHVGNFPAEFQTEEKFCLVHLDADQYEVTYQALHYFYNKMTPGGYIVLDDYEWPNCPGVKRALWEFLAGKPECIVQETEFQAYIQKE